MIRHKGAFAQRVILPMLHRSKSISAAPVWELRIGLSVMKSFCIPSDEQAYTSSLGVAERKSVEDDKTPLSQLALGESGILARNEQPPRGLMARLRGVAERLEDRRKKATASVRQLR